ncbi:MAG: hypothetical protein ACE37D_07860 [Pseudomonadales bacterium]
MDKTTFAALAASYGCNIDSWPTDHQAAAAVALKANPDWQSLLDQEQRLDAVLDQYQVASNLSALEASILEQTVYRRGLLQKLLDWLSPEVTVWRPALAACLPIVVGMMLGSSIQIEEQFVLAEELALVQFEASSFDDSTELDQ